MFFNTKNCVILALTGMLLCNATGAPTVLADQPSFRTRQYTDFGRPRFSSLPISQAIKTVRGNGSRHVAVFSDPDCPYCRKLESDTLSKLDNVTIYTFLFPLEQHADANRKAALIWCAPDPSRAWQSWMLEQRLPVAAPSCAPPIAANISLGHALGVRATPTLILESGDVVMGMLSKEVLEEKLHH